jgi:hypothetical protein
MSRQTAPAVAWCWQSPLVVSEVAQLMPNVSFDISWGCRRIVLASWTISRVALTDACNAFITPFSP